MRSAGRPRAAALGEFDACFERHVNGSWKWTPWRHAGSRPEEGQFSPARRQYEGFEQDGKGIFHAGPLGLTIESASACQG